jgi:PAS domain S-box-containing protein
MRFNETEYASPGQLDFVPRERRSQIWKLLLASSIAIALIFVLALAPQTATGRLMGAFGAMLVAGVLCFYTVYRKQQSLDLVMATEYQNMLFAQAVGLGSNFTLFVRRDGTIVYSDDGLSEIFPNARRGDSEALETVFEQGGVAKADRERILGAIYGGQSDRLVFPLHRGGEELEYVLTVEPLPRPGGYSILRGRQYRGQRTGMQLMPDVLRTTSADKLDHLLSTSPAALYVTDNFGRLEYVNPALEQLLGYHGGELLEARISIHRLFYKLNGQPVPDDYTLADFAGDVLLQKKQGTLVNAVLQQSLMRDAENKVVGATGTMLPSEASHA